jgi:hypothetical protein
LYPPGSIPFGDHVDFTALRITKSAGSLIDKHAQPFSVPRIAAAIELDASSALIQVLDRGLQLISLQASVLIPPIVGTWSIYPIPIPYGLILMLCFGAFRPRLPNFTSILAVSGHI